MAFTSGEVPPELIVFAAIVLVIYLGYSLVGAIAEFVLLESLRSGEVHVRRYGVRNVRPGVRLFGFRLGTELFGLVLVAGPLLAIYFASGAVSVEQMGPLGVLLGITVFLGYAVVNRFTTVFVAPTMLQTDLGVIAAWKRFWPTLTANWKEFLVYLLLIWMIQLVIGFLLVFVFVVVFLVLAIPLVLIALIPFLGIIVLFLAVPLLVLIAFLIQVPFVTSLRYYALLVLGDTDAELDLISDQRAVIRGLDRAGSDGSGGWESDAVGSIDRSTDDGGSNDWESDDSESDDGALNWDDDSDPDSRDSYDPWGDSSESDDDRGDRDDRDGW